MSNVPPDENLDAEEPQSTYDLNTRLLTTAVLCLLFVVAVLVFLHLYARYVLRRHRAAHRTSIVSFFRAGPATAPRDDAPNPGLDASAIAALPTFPYRSTTISVSNGKNDGSDAECTICLSMIKEGERVRLLPSCRHVFHVSCIDMWLSSTSTCPVCRAVMEPAPTTVTVEMGESSASQPGTESSGGGGGGGGGAESTSGSKEGGSKESGSMSSLFSSSFRRMYMLSRERPAGRRTTGDGMEDLERL